MTSYVILGKPRSGTSVTAHILHTLGVCMGQEFEKPDQDWCKYGFFADLELKMVHVGMWRHELKVTEINDDDRREKLEQYRLLIKKREETYDRWGIKDHAMTFVFPVIEPLFSSPPVLIKTTRSIEKSAKSWSERKKVPYEEAMLVMQGHHDQLLKYKADHVVDFESLINDPLREVEKLAELIGVPVTPEAIAVVDPEQKRF